MPQYMHCPSSIHLPSTKLHLNILSLCLGAVFAAPLQAQPSGTAPPADVSPTAGSAPPAADAASAPGRAPSGTSLERVEIIGGPPSDSEARRQSTASKIVIGRDELDRMGDTNVSDVLKRLPGVTIGGRPGRRGEIRMRGLGSGYTQILVNGERIPFGFSIDTLTPEQIERIEVSRAPTAETGARAIAGSINIVLREDVKRRLNNVNLGLGREAGQNQAVASWTRGDQLGDLNYNLSLSAYRHHNTDQSRVVTTDTAPGGATTLAQTEQRDSLSSRQGIHLGGRVLYKLGDAGNVSLMPFVMTSRGTSRASASLSELPGSSPPAGWATADTRGDSSFSLARLNTQWQGRALGNRFELKGGVNRSTSQNHSSRLEFGTQPQRLDTSTDVTDRGWSAGGKLSRPFGADHSVAIGWESEGRHRAETKVIASDARPVANDLSDNANARSLRAAAWAQDEWNFSSTWSAYAGLRWEAITTTSELGNVSNANGNGALSNRSRVWSPLLHSVWKLDEASKDQIRFALTRSYRNPTLQNLIARPNPDFSDSPTQPLLIGNPALLPELATGVDLAFEYYLSAGGLASVSLFQRRISNLIRTLTTQETVNLSGTPELRWVARPQNVGTAVSSGVEFEAKFRLAELWNESAARAPNVDLRSNLSLFRSKVSGVDGPDNRLDQQPRASANLGADWKLAASQLTLGANVNWTPAGSVTLSSDIDQGGTSQRVNSSAKRVVDAYALWTFSPAVQLRLSGANLLAQDALSSSSVASLGNTELAQTTADTYRVWTLKLELKL